MDEKSKKTSPESHSDPVDWGMLQRGKKSLEEYEKSEMAGEPKMFNAMSLAYVGLEFAVLIGAPLFLFTWLGRWLDARYGTKYWVLAGMGLALLVSIAAVAKEVKRLTIQRKK